MILRSPRPPSRSAAYSLGTERQHCPKFDDADMLDLLDRLGVTPAGRALLPNLMSGIPVREVNSRVGNIITSVYSWKMRAERRYEAMTTEFPLGQEKELSTNIVGFWTQPHRFHLNYQFRGKTIRTHHTPDFFSIQRFPARAILEEVKTEAEWTRIAVQRPGWVVKEGGRWINPTLADYFDRVYGYEYRIRSSDEFPAQRVANYSSLKAYYAPDAKPVPDEVFAELQEHFKVQSFVPLRDLLDAGVAIDHVNKAVADGIVAFDFDNDDVDDTGRAMVYRDLLALRMVRQVQDEHDHQLAACPVSSLMPGSEIIYDGVTYVASIIGKKKVTLVAECGLTELDLTDVVQMIKSGRAIIVDGGQATPVAMDGLQMTGRQMRVAQQKLEELRGARENRASFRKSQRTLQRWNKILRDAGPNLSNQLAAIAPKLHLRGNREERVDEKLTSAFEDVLKSHNSPRAPNVASSYREYLLLCAEKNLRPISRSAFFKKMRVAKSTRKRQGKRRGYATEPIVLYLDHKVNVHGTRPMQAVHIDHTPIDVEITDKTGMLKLSTVWLSLAMDASSRAVVGFSVSFEVPSYRSCMMVIRDIVRRQGRVPDLLFLDNGKDFKSHALLRLAALYQIDIRWRPAGEPRYGAVMERLFGTTTTQLFNNLEGNKELMKHFRSITKTFQPVRHKRWTLPAIHGALNFYFSKLYGLDTHPAHGEAPVEFFERRMIETGQRVTRLVRYDRQFMIETCPSVKKSGTRVVDNQRGVKVDCVWYWSDTFARPVMDGQAVEIRIDPWDPRYIYALVQDRWETCRSKLVGALRRMTVLELRHASSTIEKNAGVKAMDLSRERLQDWADVLKPELFDSRLHLEQQEMAYLFEPLKMTSVEFADSQKSEDALVEAATKLSAAAEKIAVHSQSVLNPTRPSGAVTPAAPIPVNTEAEIETF